LNLAPLPTDKTQDPERAVQWLLDNKKETPHMEAKRSIGLIRVNPSKIEKSIVAIANSCPASWGWLVFGVDNESFDLVGAMSGLRPEAVTTEDKETCKQRFSQIASKTRPPISYEWLELQCRDQDVIIIRISGRREGEFFQTSQGAAFYRLDDDTYVAEQSQIRRWLGEPELAEQTSSPVGTALAIYIILCLVGLSWAVLWVLDPLQAYQRTIWTLLGLGTIILIAAHLMQWKVENMAAWCKEKSPVLLLAAISFVPAALMLQLSLSFYPMLSGLYFTTHLSDALSTLLKAILLIIAGGVVLHLPGLSLAHAKLGILSWIPNHSKLVKKAAVASLIIGLAATSIVPLDSYFVLGTPKVGLVESKYVTDDTAYLYHIELTKFGTYVKNQETIHFLPPVVLLVRQVWYSLPSNCSVEPPKLILQNEVSATLDTDVSDGRLHGLWISISGDGSSNLVTAVTYCTELNVSSVAAITFSAERTVETLSNGTRRVQQTFQVVNLSPYRLNIGFTRLFYSTGYFEEATNVTRGRADVWYDKDSRWICLAGELREDGSVTITVLYNAVS